MLVTESVDSIGKNIQFNNKYDIFKRYINCYVPYHTRPGLVSFKPDVGCLRKTSAS